MKRFSDLGISQSEDRKIFNCSQVSISDVVNCEIEVLDYITDVKTSQGEGRCLVHCRSESGEVKFFSNASSIKAVLDLVPKEEFPFLTTIRCVNCGKGKIYQFT